MAQKERGKKGKGEQPRDHQNSVTPPNFWKYIPPPVTGTVFTRDGYLLNLVPRYPTGTAELKSLVLDISTRFTIYLI
jgi:hypothetical protein